MTGRKQNHLLYDSYLQEEWSPMDTYFKDDLKRVRPQLEAYADSLEQKIQRMNKKLAHVRRQIAGIDKILGESDDL